MSVLTDFMIASADIISFVIFLGAVIISLRNYRQTFSISVTWLLYLLAMAYAAVFALLNSLEWFGVFPGVLDEVQIPIYAVASAALAGVAIVSYVEVIKPG